MVSRLVGSSSPTSSAKNGEMYSTYAQRTSNEFSSKGGKLARGSGEG